MKATKSSQMLALIAAGLVGGTLANNAFASKKPAPKAEAAVATEEGAGEAKDDKQNCAAAKGEKQGCAAKKEKQSCKGEKQSCKGKKAKAKAEKAESEEHAE